MDPIIMAALAQGLSAAINYGSSQSAQRAEGRAARADKRMARGRADYLRQWTHPQERVARAEADLGGGGKLFDDRRKQMGDKQALEMQGTEAAVTAANQRAAMLRQQVQAQRIGGAANALGGLAALYEPVPQQDPYGGAMYGRPVGGPSGPRSYMGWA